MLMTINLDMRTHSIQFNYKTLLYSSIIQLLNVELISLTILTKKKNLNLAAARDDMVYIYIKKKKSFAMSPFSINDLENIKYLSILELNVKN